MSYVDEHLGWLAGRGFVVQSLEEARALHPELLVATGTLETMPPEVAEWYAAMPYARRAHAGLAQPWSAFMPPTTPDVPPFEEFPEFARYQELGLFPLRPLFFASIQDVFIMVETVGERAGWLFAFAFEDLDYTVAGPFAESIPQYLAAIRRLVELGLLSVDSNPAWIIEETSAHSPWPPNDSPGPLFGLNQPRFSPDVFVTLEPGTPIAPSIRDILPDFTTVTIDD